MQMVSDRTEFDQLLAKLTQSWKGLLDKPEETPETTLCALWLCAAGDPTPVQHLHRHTLPPLDKEAWTLLGQMVDLRVSGVPLAYITQRQSYMGLELWCGPEAMIPRQETEILGRAALDRVRRLADERDCVRVVDLCTGSGNLALALAFHEPRCVVTGADISISAIELATHNAERLGLTDRVNFVVSDLFEAFDCPEFIGHFDLITCNPPYISTAGVETMPLEIAQFEPRQAFDGGPFGVRVITRLIREAPRFLKSDSWLAFEIGLGQDRSVGRLLTSSSGFVRMEAHCDRDGAVRAFSTVTNVAQA